MNIRLLSAESEHEFKQSAEKVRLSNYDPNGYPADLGVAKEHGMAQRIGCRVGLTTQTTRCLCCMKSVEQTQLPISCDLQEMSHLGGAIPLYFTFIKQVVILLAICFVVYGIPTTIMNINGQMCSKLSTVSSFSFFETLCVLSVMNIMDFDDQAALKNQTVLNLLLVILSACLISYFEVQTEQLVQVFVPPPRAVDYSVLIHGLPRDVTMYQVQAFVQQRLPPNIQDPSLVKIYLIYDMKSYVSLYENKKNLVAQLLKLNHLQLKDSQRPISKMTYQQLLLTREASNSRAQIISELENKIELIEIEINLFEDAISKLASRLRNRAYLGGALPTSNTKPNQESAPSSKSLPVIQFSGKCIITMNDISARNALLTPQKTFLHTIGQLLEQSHRPILIEASPDPTDIIFGNMGSRAIMRWKKQLCYGMLLFGLLLADFLLLTGIKRLLKKGQSMTEQNLIFSILNSMIISGFNSLLSRAICHFESESYHNTHSSSYYKATSYMVKLLLINTLLTTFFCSVVSFYIPHGDSDQDYQFALNVSSFLLDIFIIMITNPLMSYFMIFFDHRQGTRYLMRFLIENNYYPCTQSQAHLHFQNAPMDLARKYTNVLRFGLFCGAVITLLPLAGALCSLSLIGFYWLDKYLLLRRQGKAL